MGGKFSLHAAASSHDFQKLCQELQSNTARINEQQEDGLTPLMVCCACGFDPGSRELVKRGAALDMVDKAGRTALHHACQGNHVECAKALLSARPRPAFIPDAGGKYPHDLINTSTRNGAALAALMGPRPVPRAPAQQPAAQQPQQPQQHPQQYQPHQAPQQYPQQPPQQYQQQSGQYATAGGPSPARPYAGAAPNPGTPQAPGPIGAPPTPSPGSIPFFTPPAAQPPAPAAVRYPPVASAMTSVPLPNGQPGAGAGAATAVHPQQPPGPRPNYPPAPTGPIAWPNPAAPPGPTAPTTRPPAAQPPPPTAAVVERDDGGWGDAGSDDDWGGESGPSGSGGSNPVARPQGGGGGGLGPGALIGALLSAPQKALEQLARLSMAPPPLQGLPQPPPPHQGPGGIAGAGGGSGGSGGGTQAVQGPAGRLYSYQQLYDATECFAERNKLGAGGYGPVYKGTLDGLSVAVKVLDRRMALQGPQEFEAEVNLLYRLHHPHIVTLIGSCPERGLIVYELMDGGSMDMRLWGRGAGAPLTWQDRVRIASELAAALLYLHSAVPPVVHMDIKPANVLLSSGGAAKLGDVGLARLLHAGSAPMPDESLVGTLGYLDPEYMSSGHVTEHCDVYALGVVLLQLLSGIEDPRSAVAQVRAARQSGGITDAIDPRAGPWPAAEAAAFADVALRCVAARRSDRASLRAEILPSLLQLRQRAAQLYPSWSSQAPATAAPAQPQAQREQEQEPPPMFLCPITQDVMEDPVFADDGYTYERLAIEAWLSKSLTSPLTNVPLQSKHLVPNHVLRSAIKEWQERQGQRVRAPAPPQAATAPSAPPAPVYAAAPRGRQVEEDDW